MASRLRFACMAILSLLVPFLAFNPAAAQSYPNRNVTLIVAFAAGGVADSVGRLLGQKLSERIGYPVVIENRAGAGGNIAARAVAGAVPDGYTLLVTTTAFAINETMYKNKGFSAKDFQTIAVAASSPESLATHPDNPGSNIGEFLKAFAGKPINFGTAGVGSGSHIAAEYFFKVLAKVPATHIPFQGGAPATNAAIANQINLLALTVGGGVSAQINAGKLKGLAIASDRRATATPGVPTYAEGGYPFYAASWVGFFAPAKTPTEVIARLHAEIDAIVNDPEVQQRLRAVGFDPVTGSQAEAAKYVDSEVESWGKMVNTVGLSID